MCIENQGVTHIFSTKPYITYGIVLKFMSLKSLYQKVIYSINFQKKNADPDKRCCFKITFCSCLPKNFKNSPWVTQMENEEKAQINFFKAKNVCVVIFN